MKRDELDRIINAACNVCGCAFEEFFSTRRTEAMYYARSFVSKYLSCDCGLTTSEIGELTNKHRDVVSRQIRCFNERYDVMKDFRFKYELFIKEVENGLRLADN